MKMPSPTEWALIELLTAREISGRDLARLYEKETGKSMSYGTLYTTMRRLKDAGWVDVREDEDGDGRVRLFKISGKGAQARIKLVEFRKALGAESHAIPFGFLEGRLA
ncbi:PadR family transcriptional regulator [Verrucomicrobium sp. BvORR106]|uniref:PadR family transcriptional regulator n=1 Tax=Verrucomicrobium sp. BvORR106 TaxID=1403819 RepID=UPI00056F4521|nr:PadR family transcriptional regulator [Verrucomicrobium sp. BvORR106]